MKGQCQPPIAPSLSIAAHMSSVGTMSMIAALITLSGWSRHMRCVVRPPRSWPAT